MSCEFNVDSLSCEAKSAEAAVNDTATTYCSCNDTVSAEPDLQGPRWHMHMSNLMLPADCSDAEESIIITDGNTSRISDDERWHLNVCERELLRMRQHHLALNLVECRDTFRLEEPSSPVETTSMFSKVQSLS
ncbi:hypothetical protein PRIC2_008599 [Phytophthora ramorum]